MQVWHLLKEGVLTAEIMLGIPVLYLSLVSLSAIRATRRQRSAAHDQPIPPITFAILVPAHNEEETLGVLLDSLSRLTYPKERYDVYIVADNCTDNTAALARAAGWVHVYERHDDRMRGKGHALSWIMQQLDSGTPIHDAYVIFDADSVIAPDFLTAMAREIGHGARALQGRVSVLNPGDAPSTSLRSIGLTLIAYLRPLGRSSLGFSATLTGNGMCFVRNLLRRHPWRAFALGEDYLYYLTLVLHGERVRYVPDAVVQTAMPTTFAQQRTQDIRWESSQGFPSAWKIVGDLLSAGLRNRDIARIEAIAEFLTPSLSVLVFGCVGTLIAAVLLAFPVALLVSLLLMSGLLVYGGAGLYLLHPPSAVYKALLYAPLFMAWKLWVVLVLARTRKHTSAWVRTSRTLPQQSQLKG